MMAALYESSIEKLKEKENLTKKQIQNEITSASMALEKLLNRHMP